MSAGPSGQSDGLLRHYGKFRGTVTANNDPEQRGRIQAMVPDVLGMTPSTWAMPALPLAGKQEGTYAVPQLGAAVWIEFEQGDPDFPIWTGGFWGSSSEVPPLALAPAPIPPGQNIVVQTTGRSVLVLSDAAPTQTAGGIILQSPSGAKIVVNDSGIYIQNGQGASITLVGPNVNVNDGALTIT
jgi:uncharacterized protein involved in type VI secretion and phage assembly